MKKIAVIGAKGTVGKTLVEFFENFGHQVLSVDRDTEWTLSAAAAQADIVFIVTLPIEEVGQLISEATAVMKPGALLIHGTSIERPSPNRIDPNPALAKGITFAHLHFHFRPEVPLATTLFGQHVTYSGAGKGWVAWRAWLLEQFEPVKPFLHELGPGQHDQITGVSQLIHMLVALLVTRVWSGLSLWSVTMAMRICGPPGRFLIRSVLRVGSGAKVAESVVYNHPLSLTILERISEACADLRHAIRMRQPGGLAVWLSDGRAIPKSADLARWDSSTARLARFDADTDEEPQFEFRFSQEQNQTGLLARILEQFDMRGVDKTSTLAQKNPDGGCVIIIGVRELSELALEAERIVRNWKF